MAYTLLLLLIVMMMMVVVVVVVVVVEVNVIFDIYRILASVTQTASCGP